MNLLLTETAIKLGVATNQVLEAAKGTVKHVGEKTFNLGTDILSHHLNDAVIKHLEIGGFNVSITKRVVMMWIVAFLLLAIFIPGARAIAKRKYSRPSRFTGLLESLIGFIRKDVAQSALGKHSRNYEPYLLTIFFFILFCNLIGLVPPIGELMQFVAVVFGFVHVDPGAGAHHIPFLVALWPGITATGDLSVNLVLAGISLFLIFLAGFANQGIGFIKNVVPGGIHWALWPLMWPIEFMSIFIKSGVLAIRLLANMTAGHVIILVLMGFIFQFQSYALVFVSIPSAVAMFMLELIVAFLQAYIFTFLTALFVASAQHRH